MPTDTYATPTDVENKMEYLESANLTEAEVQEKIEEGHRTMEIHVGRYYTDTVQLDKVDYDTGDLVKTYDLSLSQVLEMDEVRVGNQVLTEGTHYTYDADAATITFKDAFVDDFSRGVEVTVKYVPGIIKDLEAWYALHILLTEKVWQVDDEQVLSEEERATRKMKNLENKLGASQKTMSTVSEGRVLRGTR